VSAVVDLSNCSITVSALYEGHWVATSHWLFDRYQTVEALEPSISVEPCSGAAEARRRDGDGLQVLDATLLRSRSNEIFWITCKYENLGRFVGDF
jgi:hypothetical protein